MFSDGNVIVFLMTQQWYEFCKIYQCHSPRFNLLMMSNNHEIPHYTIFPSIKLFPLLGQIAHLSALSCFHTYKFDGPGFESSRHWWPRSLRRGPVAARLLELRFRIPPVAWMFVLYSNDKGTCQDNQDKETSDEKGRKETTEVIKKQVKKR